MDKVCDVCGKGSELEFVSSGCAPVTYAACAECRSHGAENIDVAALWFHMEGKSSDGDAYLSRILVWENGAYVGRESLLTYYEAHREEIAAEMAEEIVLMDDDVPIENKN